MASDLERVCVCVLYVGFLFLVKFISILLCMCCIADFAMGFMRAAPFLRQYYSLQYWKLPKTTRPSPTSPYTICAYKQALCACVFVAGCFYFLIPLLLPFVHLISHQSFAASVHSYSHVVCSTHIENAHLL